MKKEEEINLKVQQRINETKNYFKKVSAIETDKNDNKNGNNKLDDRNLLSMKLDEKYKTQEDDLRKNLANILSMYEG